MCPMSRQEHKRIIRSSCMVECTSQCFVVACSSSSSLVVRLVGEIILEFSILKLCKMREQEEKLTMTLARFDVDHTLSNHVTFSIPMIRPPNDIVRKTHFTDFIITIVNCISRISVQSIHSTISALSLPRNNDI